MRVRRRHLQAEARRLAQHVTDHPGILRRDLRGTTLAVRFEKAREQHGDRLQTAPVPRRQLVYLRPCDVSVVRDEIEIEANRLGSRHGSSVNTLRSRCRPVISHGSWLSPTSGSVSYTHLTLPTS